MTRRTRNWLNIVAIGFLMVPIVVSSTPPSPPPCHWFRFKGRVSVEGGGSAQNYTVVVLGRGGKMVPGEWNTIHSDCVDTDYGSARDVALTDVDGDFDLSVWTRDPPDSLAVAVVQPSSLTVGNAIVRQGLDSNPIEETVTGDDGDSGGCEDGGVTTWSSVVAYRYETVEGVAITAPPTPPIHVQ